MAIEVIFGGDALPNVTGVQPGSQLSSTSIVDQSSLVGYRTRSIRVRGFVKKDPDYDSMLAEQKATEDAFAAKGPGTIDFPGITPYTARLTSWEWEEWANGPIVRYTATFATEEESPFSRDVTVGQYNGALSKTFDPRPSVDDQFRNTDSVDESLSPDREKTISIDGVIRGTIAEVDAEETEIITLLTTDTTFDVVIPSGLYVCKVDELTFGTPAGDDLRSAKSFSIKLKTLPDFTLEARSIQGGPLTLGPITWDVAGSFSHTVQRDAADSITSESMNAGGKKFFTSIANADAYKSTIDGYVNSGVQISSPTGRTLRVGSVNWSEPKRDGHTLAGARRYSLQFSVSAAIDTSENAANLGSLSGTVLGVVFDSLDSVSYSASIKDDGSVSSRTKSGSGKVTTVPTVRPGDAVSDDGRTYYLTSLSLGTVDGSGRRQVSVSGQTLDTEAAAEELFPLFFEGFFLDHVSSQTKSVSYQRDSCTGLYVATAVNASVSGFRIGDDGGVLNLIQTINRLEGTFIITNVSRSAPEKKLVDGAIQTRINISISGTLNLANQAGSCTDAPIVKEETTRTIEDATTKYAQIPIPGKGIVFKKIGMNPATEVATIRRVANNQLNFEGMGFPADPSPTIAGAVQIGRTVNTQGLSKSITVRWQAFTGAVQVG